MRDIDGEFLTFNEAMASQFVEESLVLGSSPRDSTTPTQTVGPPRLLRRAANGHVTLAPTSAMTHAASSFPSRAERYAACEASTFHRAQAMDGGVHDLTRDEARRIAAGTRRQLPELATAGYRDSARRDEVGRTFTTDAPQCPSSPKRDEPISEVRSCAQPIPSPAVRSTRNVHLSPGLVTPNLRLQPRCDGEIPASRQQTPCCILDFSG